MNKDVEKSRLRISRRRALAVGGTVSLGGLIAACTGNGSSSTSASATSTAAASSAATTSADTVSALLDQAPQCVMAVEETQGPYWFDVDSIRSDIREDRPGTKLQLALRVQDLTNCSADGSAAVVSNAVVEIWHCDAGGVYSGFESGSRAADLSGNGAPAGAPPVGGPGGGGQPPAGGPGGPGAGGPGGDMSGGSGETSDGSYSVGDSEAATTDDGTYLRGAQTTDANGIAQFTTIFPGWYTGRTTHIHLKVHIDKKTVLTTQLFFDEALLDEVYATAPYSDHTGRENNVNNSTDSIYDAAGLLTVAEQSDGYLAAINLGIDV
ncbi:MULTISPECIES: intradiol ring-cleavage dioxygenase [unclassified Rhodococcus (in: high G+C Gram-positive bacteria)]|uniref:intradiol ring-cleavage dioxygenase n=1 Tax=unclassified Rhodococcus (in: high G+C Gram-positive bacteria) TaxID=192944 RepID=UPI000300BC00|nr:intradiol ring-cleavage dioxygenase [Rhodococcus sp. DK17]